MSEPSDLIHIQAPDADVVVSEGVASIVVRAGVARTLPIRFRQAALIAGLSLSPVGQAEAPSVKKAPRIKKKSVEEPVSYIDAKKTEQTGE
jgi:hypothetical protein